MADARAAVRRAVRTAVVVALVLAFAGIFQHDLWTADEPREAEIGREMLLSGFSAVPTLAGEPFLEKPPLFAWCVAASYRVLGVSAGAARVPAALFGLGGLWVTFALARRAGGRVAGLCAVVVLATMAQFVQTTHKAILDTALLFFVGAGQLAVLRLRSGGPALGYLLVAGCSGFAFLSKTWVGPGLICAPAILASVVQRDGAFLRRVAPRLVLASAVGTVAAGLPWVLALAAAPNGGWDRVHECLVTETLGRAVGAAAEWDKGGHAHGPFHYIPTVAGVVAPWILALPALVRSGVLSRSWRDGRVAWMALTFVTGVVLLSVPSGKRDLYLVPLLPALAAAFGVWLSRAGSRRGGAWDRATLVVLAAAVLLSGAAVLWVASGLPVPRSAREEIAATAQAIGRTRALAILAAGVCAAALGLLAVARARAQLPRLARAASVAVLGSVVAYLAVVRPALDPIKELRTGALRVSALVPAEEPLLGLDCDETTRAVLPYYSRREMIHVRAPAEALARLASGPARHVILARRSRRDGREWSFPGPLRERLRLLGTVDLALDREVAVFESSGP